MTVRMCATAAIAVAAIMGSTALLQAQQAGMRSVWDGVYSAAQADRGKTLFGQNCELFFTVTYTRYSDKHLSSVLLVDCNVVTCRGVAVDLGFSQGVVLKHSFNDAVRCYWRIVCLRSHDRCRQEPK